MRIDAVPQKKQRTHSLYCYGKISEVLESYTLILQPVADSIHEAPH